MAKIDVTQIEGFDGMSAEEKLNAVLGLDLNDGSEEIKRLKDAVSKANSEAASWKNKHKEQLSEEERKMSEQTETMQQLQEELEMLRKEKAVSSYTAKLLETGFDADEAAKAATALSDGNMDAFWSHLTTLKPKLEKSIKAELQKRNPDPGGSGGGNSTMTKEKYDKLSMTEKMKFMNEHREEYAAMKK